MARDSVYDRVVHHLLRSGDIRPGDRVVETQLAARLGVSRIPVRERLHVQNAARRIRSALTALESQAADHSLLTEA